MAASFQSISKSAASDHVSAIRRFNRFYTRQLGLLNEGLLNSAFSLTQGRILYELGQGKDRTAAELCDEMGLDAGYLSRILSGFEKQGLIEKKSSPDDARQSLLSLTRKGQKVFESLNASSAAEVSAMLSKLLPGKQDELVRAMKTVESILSPDLKRANGYVLRPPRPGDMGWVTLRHGVLYRREYGYDERFEALVARIAAESVENFDPAAERCWIAEKDGENVGSVFLVHHSQSVAKLRLLLVEPAARGLGIGRHLVSECVKFARDAGYRKIKLWTQSELSAARGIYQKAGFKLVKEEPHQSWGRNDLVAETWELKL